MYIRRTQTRNTASGERYYTYRLVESKRVEGKVKQITRLNLGRHFDVGQDHWVSMANNFDPLSANKIDPPGATKISSRVCASVDSSHLPA